MGLLSKRLQVDNIFGLHARPATVIVKLLEGTQAKVSFFYGEERVNARSIMEILLLAAPRGAQIVVAVDGVDADLVMSRLEKAFANRFWEDIHHKVPIKVS